MRAFNNYIAPDTRSDYNLANVTRDLQTHSAQSGSHTNALNSKEQESNQNVKESEKQIHKSQDRNDGA